MAKGVPHVLSGRRPKKPIIRPKRVNPKVAAAQAAAPKPAPAPKAAAPKPAPAPDPAPLHLLDGSVSSLKAALETGDHDAHLDALIAAEKADKNRKTAIEALEDRKG
jgi:hypothetical protein